MKLTPPQLQRFDSDGYLFFPGLFTPQEIKLLNDEVKARSRYNLVQSRSFADLLEKSVRRYQNRAIEAAQVIQELIDLARDMREANRRGENLKLRSTCWS